MQVVLKKIKTFRVTRHKDDNNVAVKRSIITKILEYQKLEIKKLLQLP